jgi:hypothetical protein
VKKIIIGLLLLQINSICFGIGTKATVEVAKPSEQGSIPQSQSFFQSMQETLGFKAKKTELSASSEVQKIDSSTPDIKSPTETPQQKTKFLSYIFRPAKPQPELKPQDLEISSENIEKITDTNTLSLQDFNFIKNFMRQMRTSGKLQENNDTLGASYEASLPDTQAVNNRIRNFDKATRSVSKSTLAKIKSLESQNELTFMDKRDIVESLIQDQLNTVFGTDSITGQVKVSFADSFKKELLNDILKTQPDLFDATKSDIARLDAIAKAGDKVMNKISQGQPVDATFTSKVDKDGTYTTSMKKTDENGKSIETQSIMNVDGNLIGRTMIINNGDGKGQITFITTTNPKTGISRTSAIKPLLSYDVSNKNETTSEGNKFMTVELTSAESKMTNLQFALFQSMILGKLMLKISLWSTKQVAWNLIIHPIATPITLGCIVPLALIVKTGANFAGYEQSDPTILATFGTVVDFTMGNRRAILSNEAGRVFTRGSTISNALNFVNGNKAEGYEADPNAEYFGAEAEIGKAIVYGVKQLFPDRFGDRLISKANLKKSQDIDNPELSKSTKDTSTPETSSAQTKATKPTLAQSFKKAEESNKSGREQAQQLSKAQIQLAAEIVNPILAKTTMLQKNKNVLGSSAASLLIDTNANIKRLSELDVKTRDTAQDVLNMIDTAQAKKSIIGRYKGTSLLSSKDADLAQQKQTVVEKTMQSTIDNVFGVNQLSGKSIYSLTPEAQQELMPEFKLIIEKLFDPAQKLPKYQRLQLIANMSDAIMNKMAAEVDGDSGPVATFTTEFFPDGQYATTISNEAGVKATTVIDRSGKVTQKTFTITDPETKSSTKFDMTFRDPQNPTKMLSSPQVTMSLPNSQLNAQTPLSIDDAAAVELVCDQFKAETNVKTVIKALLWTGKQVVMCAIPLPTTIVNCLIITAIAPVVIKGGSMMVGYKFSDPVVRTALMASIELTMGNKRGLLSADPNRVFSKGTIGSKIANSFTTGNISESFKEKRDPSEQYFHSIDDALIDSTAAAYNWLFSRKSLGSEKDFQAMNNFGVAAA